MSDLLSLSLASDFGKNKGMVAETLVRPFDIAVMLDCSTDTVKRMALRGELPGAVVIGRRLKFLRSEVDNFIRSGGHLSRVRDKAPAKIAA